MKNETRTKPKVDLTDNTELTLSSDPANLLDNVRNGKASLIQTKSLNIFYVHADSIEKAIRELKEKCRIVIVGRRGEGTATGDRLQHREFNYQTPQGDIKLTVQERMNWKPDFEKLEALLKKKDLWETAQTTTLDMNKVQGLIQAELITPDEMDAISAKPEPSYSLIARFDRKTP